MSKFAAIAVDYSGSENERPYVTQALFDADTEIERLRTEVERWKEAAGAHHAASMREAARAAQAEVQRDALDDALANIAVMGVSDDSEVSAQIGRHAVEMALQARVHWRRTWAARRRDSAASPRPLEKNDE